MESISKGAIWVWVEHQNGLERPVVHELLSQGRKIADSLQRPLWAVSIGNGTEGLAQRLQGHPDGILLLEGEAFERFVPELYAAALSKQAALDQPFLILSSCGLRAMDLMARVSVRLRAAIISEVTALWVEGGGTLKAVRPVHGGKAYMEMEARGEPPFIAAARPRAFSKEAGSKEAEVRRVQIQLEDPPRASRWLESMERPSKGADLQEASVVVSGGRGMGGAEAFGLLEELAELLGGAVGASRAVVDSRWRPHDEQVGKSGKTVSPELYMAFGISGAVHHVMGMDTSKYVVAVNSDPNALIFNHADYGVVEDVSLFIPALLKELKAIKG
jgi:electron transfer flavoprotein alpha subunit